MLEQTGDLEVELQNFKSEIGCYLSIPGYIPKILVNPILPEGLTLFDVMVTYHELHCRLKQDGCLDAHEIEVFWPPDLNNPCPLGVVGCNATNRGI